MNASSLLLYGAWEHQEETNTNEFTLALGVLILVKFCGQISSHDVTTKRAFLNSQQKTASNVDTYTNPT